MKAAYDACMDEEKIKKDGIKPLQEILHQIADLFPVKATAFGKGAAVASIDEEDLADTILYLTKIGISSVVSCGAGADDKDPDAVIVQISPPYRIGLPAKDFYKDETIVGKYEKALAQVIDKVLPDRKNESARLSEGYNSIAAWGQSKEYAHGVIELEKRLAAISPNAEDRDDVTVGFGL